MAEVLLPVSTQELMLGVEERLEAIRQRFDITVLYGWHLTPKQAQEVVDSVKPGAIVFTEGYLIGKEYAQMRLEQHVALAEARLGTASSESDIASLEERLATEFLDRNHSTPTEHDLHSFTLYTSLLDKGCVILPSDYINLGDGTPGIEDISDLRQELEIARRFLTETSLEDLIAKEEKVYDTFLANNKIREESATKWIAYFLGRYVDNELVAAIPNDRDKVPVYILFGLAHRNSLTERLRSLGLEFDIVHLNSSDIPTERLMDLALDFTIQPEERRKAIRNHYLGILAAQQTEIED